MAFSAAELQKRHGLEGAPDPFPALGNAPAPSPSVKKVSSNGASATPAPVDTSSEDAFPSLGTSAAPATTISKPAVSMWSTKPATIKASKGTAKPSGAGGLGRSGVPTAGSHPFAETFSLPTTDIETGKTMGEVLKKVSEQTGAIVESSTQMRTGLKTFHLRAADAKRLAYARKMIERGLSKSVTILVEVPITTLGTIIGPKGATLKGITDSTQCKIDIPRRDTLPTYEPAEGNESDDEHEEPQVAISVTGPSVACNDAKSKILALISHKTSQTSTSIKNIPSSYYPFIAGPKGSKARQLEEEFGDVKIHVPPPAVWKALEKQAQGEEDVIVDRDLSIKVRGDKEKVKLVIASITKRYEELTDSLREFKISIPKRQHRFLVGAAADDILDQTSCIVELPPVEDPSDLCVIRGPQPSLIPALTLVMDKANAIAVEMVDIVALHRPNTSDPLSHAKKVLRYLQRSSKLRSIAEAHEGVKVFPPFASAVASTGSVVVEIVSENKAEVAKAKDDVAAAVKAIVPSAIVTVEVDPLVHPLLIGKKGSKIAQFESANEVTIVFPPAADESSEVLLVYTGTASSLPTDKKAKEAKLKELLNAASAALSELAKEAADIKSETLDIEKKWHRFIIGQGGTVLNALIGEDHLVNVKVGSGSGSKSGAKTNGAAASTSDEDIVVVRGPSGEVDRVVAQIKQIVEDAKNDDIINGYTVEFSVDKKHVPHLVGSAGAAINKLRETLGVKINFDDEAEGKKGKKAVAHCSIVGRKEAVEEAKKRLEAQIEKLEDETTETVTIKRAIQPALIGSGGKYAIRLEEKYGVKLSFPRDGKDGAASSKPDDVTIRGGKKGVAAAKAELLEAAAFEAESRQSLSFTVPTKAVAQIVGKSGSTINGIKDETGAQIDIDKAPGDDGKTTVTVRGDKKAIAAAKAKVLEVVEQAGDEVQVSVTVDPKYHRNLIGQGGGKLRELIANCGGPSEGFKQAGLVTFPKAGDSHPDQVRLRGESKVVKAIQAELEKQVAILQSTITIGVVVPHSQHASKIGRGGSALQDLQRKTGTVIHFPGSRQYGTVGEVDNKSELGDADEKDIVKVIGSKEACAQAAELLQVSSERPSRSDENGRNRDHSEMVSRTLSFPAKYYHAIADQPNLIRQIRSTGGHVNLPQPAPPRPKFEKKLDGVDGTSTSLAAKVARIDLDSAEQEEELVQGEWELRDNFEGMPAGDLEWVVRARSEEELERAVGLLEAAAEKAKGATHVGLLTGLPRSAFPRIIGSKGATISRLRIETGADIQVGKDDDLIVITGDEAAVLQAKDAIVGIASRQGGQRY